MTRTQLGIPAPGPAREAPTSEPAPSRRTRHAHGGDRGGPAVSAASVAHGPSRTNDCGDVPRVCACYARGEDEAVWESGDADILNGHPEQIAAP